MLDEQEQTRCDLSKLREAKVINQPFNYAVIDDILSAKQAAALRQGISPEYFYRSKRDSGSDKTYDVANRILFELNSDRANQVQSLPKQWRDLVEFLKSKAYNRALSDTLKIDLSQCHLEITLKQYSQHDYISSHTDRSWVDATHLFFLNSYWDESWGGMLRFLTDDQVAFLTVPPLFNQSVAFIRSDNSWHEVTPITHATEKRLALQVAFWNTTERVVLPGRKTHPVDQNMLEIELFGRKIHSPFILGSGTLVERYEQIQPYLDAGIGMVIPRTTRKSMRRETHPVPHLYQAGTRKQPLMINCEWTGADIEYWRDYLGELAALGTVVMSISGRDIDDCVAVCQELEEYQGWSFYEVNVSCAHSNSVHGMITRDKDHVRTLMNKLKGAGITTPIALKFGHSDNIVELCCIAEQSGADAVVLLNTYGPVFDFTIAENGKPQPVVGIEGGKGGLSGAPLFHIALTDIAMVRRAVNIPIIGCGGVCNAVDAVKMLMAGASAVQVYTAAHALGVNAPKFFTKLNNDLVQFMQKHGMTDLNKIIGTAQSILDQQTTLAVDVPVVDTSTCIGCDLCLPVCIPDAISIEIEDGINKAGHVVAIDAEKCVGCGHCMHVCPTSPNSLTMHSLNK